MSLDYWQNEAKDCTLSLCSYKPNTYAILISDYESYAELTEQDLRNLGKSISFLLNGA
jgi:hypothetical protein